MKRAQHMLAWAIYNIALERRGAPAIETRSPRFMTQRHYTRQSSARRRDVIRRARAALKKLIEAKS